MLIMASILHFGRSGIPQKVCCFGRTSEYRTYWDQPFLSFVGGCPLFGGLKMYMYMYAKANIWDLKKDGPLSSFTIINPSYIGGES